MLDVCVIGGGIAGLTAAYRAKKAGRSVLLLENAARVGGAIRSEVDCGYLLELGPNTVQPKGELMSLIEELGLEKDLLLADAKTPRYIQFSGALHAVPLSPPALLRTKLLSPKGRWRILAEPFFRAKRNGPDESLSSFVTRRLGWEAAERLMAPFVSGVWAGDPNELSAQSSFPRLVQMEKKYGNLLFGLMRAKKEKTAANLKPLPKSLLSFKNGLETLTRALANELKDSIRLKTTLSGLKPVSLERGNVVWELRTFLETFQCRHVILALPAPTGSELLEPFAPEAAKALRNIPYAPLAAVHLGFETAAIKNEPQGFGYLAAPSENADILGCLFSSSLFKHRSPEGKTLLTVFMGGSRQKELLKKKDEALMSMAIREISKTIGISAEPVFMRLTRYEKAIPQYTLGHAERMTVLAEAEKRFPGLAFAGNYLEGIAVGDVVRQATVAAEFNSKNLFAEAPDRPTH